MGKTKSLDKINMKDYFGKELVVGDLITLVLRGKSETLVITHIEEDLTASRYHEGAGLVCGITTNIDGGYGAEYRLAYGLRKLKVKGRFHWFGLCAIKQDIAILDSSAEIGMNPWIDARNPNRADMIQKVKEMLKHAREVALAGKSLKKVKHTWKSV